MSTLWKSFDKNLMVTMCETLGSLMPFGDIQVLLNLYRYALSQEGIMYQYYAYILQLTRRHHDGRASGRASGVSPGVSLYGSTCGIVGCWYCTLPGRRVITHWLRGWLNPRMGNAWGERLVGNACGNAWGRERLGSTPKNLSS